MGNFDELLQASVSIPAAHGRFQIGKKSDEFDEIQYLRPVFSFEYACMDNSAFSFRFNAISAKDYQKLIDGLKGASTATYQSMSANYRYHFHEVKWNDVSVAESDFYKCIQNPYKGVRDLTVYQFKVFGEARVIGFIYRSIFYLVMFDRNHRAYDWDRPQRRSKRRG